MGIKIKITVLLSLTTNFIVAQNTLKELKKYALHYCIAHNYHLIDSECSTHDYTSSYILEVKKISNELMDEVRFYTEEKTDKYYKGPPPPAWLYDEQANYICYLCTDFYESQELHHFIKRLIRKYRKKQPLSNE